MVSQLALAQTRWVKKGPVAIARAVVACMLAVLIAGCEHERLPVHNVVGSVFVQGKPATGARVILHPVGESAQLQRERPMGTVQADGAFRLTTYDRGDGVPSGDYQISIIWRTATHLASGSAETDERNHAMSADRLQGRYADPETSGLRATVHSGQVNLPPIHLP